MAVKFAEPEQRPKAKPEPLRRTSPHSPMQQYPVQSLPPITPVQARPGESQLNVLFVDPSNQLRSVLAQAYAEIIRHRFLNAYGRAPFSCIDSAGLYVHSSLISSKDYSPGQLPDQTAINVLLGHHPPSKEIQDIKNRISRYRSRGLTARDFVKYDYVFCFDQESLDRLQELHQRALRQLETVRPQRTVHIRLLGSYWPGRPMEIFSPRHAHDRRHSLRESDYFNCIRDIKTSFKQFSRLHPGEDAYPSSSPAVYAPFQSRQLLAPNFRITPEKLDMLSNMYQCNLHADNPASGSENCIITVAAEPHKVSVAFEAVKDMFLRPTPVENVHGQRRWSRQM